MTSWTLYPPALPWRRHYDLIGQLVQREIQQQYRGSVLGVCWTLVQPLMTLAVYTFVFTVVFAPRTGSGDMTRKEFVVGMFCGIVVYGLFAETAARAPLLIVGNPNFVRQVVFPLEILPVVSLGTALMSFGAGVVVALIAIGAMLHTFSVTCWLLPVILLPLVFLSLGLGWFLASLGVYLRDTTHVVRVAVQLLFFMTPIVWTIDLLGESLQWWIRLNPLAVVVEQARNVLMYGRYPDWGWWGVATGISLVVMLAGYAWFVKTRKGFADVL